MRRHEPGRPTGASPRPDGRDAPADLDFDYAIIGSGFGGSVSALRLSQKGYRVVVLEVGRRYPPTSMPRTNWNLFKSLWVPALRLFGIWRVGLFRHIAILGASAVGGGSVNYGNTLYVPPRRFFDHERVRQLETLRPLLPFYEVAKKMLGVARNHITTAIDRLVRDTAVEMGRGHTYHPTDVGVHFGEAGVLAPDPYFFGEGPPRLGCELCGGCMVGCPSGAKNSLDQNYLFFAEKLGARVIPEHRVTTVRPLSPDGAAGYELVAERVTAWWRRPQLRLTARGVVFAAGVLGTLRLLLDHRQRGLLPHLSEQLGRRVSTNSEALISVRSMDPHLDLSHGVAITSSVLPDEHTHIEPCRFSKGSDFWGLAPAVLTDGGALPRQLQFLFNSLRHPLQSLRWRIPFGFARQAVYLLTMQTVENNLDLVWRRHLWWPWHTLSSQNTGEQPIPVYIPVANDFARRLARRMGGIAGNNLNEVMLNMSTTAHILGGCSMSTSPETGAVDLQNRVFGYQNMLVCDGSMIPANLGVNPSLSITAFTERAMSFIPVKVGATFRHLKAEEAWGVTELLQPA